MKMTRDGMDIWFHKAKPFLAVIFLQAGLAGMDIISKAALNEGMSNYVFVVYRHAVAFIVIAPFALAFDKLEKVKLMSIRSQAKIIGTLATVAGAMIMTLVRGPNIGLPWTKQGLSHGHQQGEVNLQHSIKGAIMITIGCFSWACFMILQAVTLRTYPAELSLTAWICLLGTAEGAAVALVMEKGNSAAWSIKWDTKFLAAAYSGIFCSGIAYYVQGVVMKERGPVFVTAFSPLSMVIVAIMSSFILAEQMYLGRVVGAFVIVMGLYFVVWGKKNDYESPLVEEKEIPVKQNTSSNVCSNLEVVTCDAQRGCGGSC
ncbi:hypothetical protein DH2020_025957 [Rehmannia glutinosa]|uniref:WAT1-related protein n=1 Tax=Rehmannia glutinosa TaxID=99300 RepID=A0ABR0W297_REHGL